MEWRDWHDWHDAYDDPDSPLSRRLEVVRERIRIALDEAPPGPLRVVSACAGQGRDLLPVLAAHPRRGDVQARLVELDPRNVAVARAGAAAAGLATVEVVEDDAAWTDRYLGLVPADLVLMCGVFGNITDEDIERTVGYCRQLCARDGIVIWTRHRKPPDRCEQAAAWFEHHGFTRVWLREPDIEQGVGVHRLATEPDTMVPGERMFTFVRKSRAGLAGSGGD